MNYIGSRHTLRPFLEGIFREVTDGSERVFCDIFAGTGAVGRDFKHLGLQVIANDNQYYSYALNRAYIEINEPPQFSGLRDRYGAEVAKHRGLFEDSTGAVLEFINHLPRVSGFIAQNYGPAGGRLYYSVENAEKTDAIRQAIETWRPEFHHPGHAACFNDLAIDLLRSRSTVQA